MYLLNNKKNIENIESQNENIKKYILNGKVHIFDDLDFLDDIEYKESDLYIFLDENNIYYKNLTNKYIYIVSNCSDIYEILNFYFNIKEEFDEYLWQ